jgi:hypothetical protein
LAILVVAADVSSLTEKPWNPYEAIKIKEFNEITAVGISQTWIEAKTLCNRDLRAILIKSTDDLLTLTQTMRTPYLSEEKTNP